MCYIPVLFLKNLLQVNFYANQKKQSKRANMTES